MKQPNGLLAIFSTSVDTFIVYNATPEEIVAYVVDDAAQQARTRAEEWVTKERPGRRHWSLDEVLPTIRGVHGDEEADLYLKEMTEEPEEPSDE